MGTDPHASVAGDAQINEWYRTHYARITRLAERMLRGTANAEDVAQETLVRAWQRRDELSGHENINAWLTKVARNLCIDQLRRCSRLVPFAGVEAMSNSEDPPENRTEAAEGERQVRGALSRISSRHREVLYRHEIQGVAYPKLASQLGIGESATRMTVSRARQSLRRQLAAVSERASAAFVAIRFRAATWTRRLIDPRWAPIAPAVIQAASVLAIASFVAVSAQTVHTAAPRVDTTRARSTAVDTSRPHVAARPPARELAASRSPHWAVSLSHDRNRMRMDAALPDPLTGGQQRVWVQVWRTGGNSQNQALAAGGQRVAAVCEMVKPCGVLRRSARSSSIEVAR